MGTDDKNLNEKQWFLGMILLWIIAMGIQMTGIMMANSQLVEQNNHLLGMNQELRMQNEKISEVLEELDNKVAKLTDHMEKDDHGELEKDFFVKANKRRTTIKKEPI
ncbi:hypothetical protein [Anaerosolibacter sp.]|uniref:hypothetical protein n=1 Tax=Anaerosolibacter sp. TaxID=1872527 RepID=UPI0039EE5CE4